MQLWFSIIYMTLVHPLIVVCTILSWMIAHSQNSAHRYFWPSSCIGSKFTRMSAQPGANFAWSLRRTASSETLCNTSLKWANVVGRTPQATPCWQWHGAVQSVVCCQDSALKLVVILFVCYLSKYLLRGHRVTVNMTWALFHGKMQKHSKECPSPSLAGVPPMGALSLDYGTSLLFSSSSWYSFWL